MVNIAVIIGSSVGSFMAAILIVFLIYKFFCNKNQDKNEVNINHNNDINSFNIDQSDRKEFNLEKDDIKLNNRIDDNNKNELFEKELKIYDDNYNVKEFSCNDNIPSSIINENEINKNTENNKSKDIKFHNVKIMTKSKIKFKKKNKFLNSYNYALSSGNTCQADDKTLTEINNSKLIADKLKQSIINYNYENSRNYNADIGKNVDLNINDNSANFREYNSEIKVQDEIIIELKLEDQFDECNHKDEIDFKNKNVNNSSNLNKVDISCYNNKNNNESYLSDKQNKIDIKILREKNSMKEQLMKKYLDSIIRSCKTDDLSITNLEIIYSEGTINESEKNDGCIEINKN